MNATSNLNVPLLERRNLGSIQFRRSLGPFRGRRARPVIDPALVYAVILQGAVIGRRVWFPVNTGYQVSRF